MLCPYLVERGFDIVGLDTGFYRDGLLYDPGQSPVTTITRDIRELEPSDLEEFDAVVHMAELSNDPVGQLAPTITYDINHEGSVRLASAAKTAGLSRFVYTSSCSVYGRSDGLVDEESPLDPQTAYADCKRLVERDVTALASDGFSPTFLRNATAYGASPRLRFDVVVNNLCGLAWTTREIKMESDGTPWRPLVHVEDICQAIARVARCTTRDSSRSDPQRRRPRRELPDSRHCGDRRRRLSRLRGDHRRSRRRRAELQGLVRSHPRRAARLQL